MKIFLPDHLSDILRDRVQRIAPAYEVAWLDAAGNSSSDPRDGEVIFLHWGVDRAVLEQLVLGAPNLRWLHTISAGVEHVLFPELIASDVVVTNARGIFAPQIAETVVAYVLAVAKHLPRFFAQQQEHRWEVIPLQELGGRTVGIVGMGGIGAAVARRCRAFDMRVIGLRKHPRPTAWADAVLPASRLHDLLAQSDFVVVTTPLTRETQGMIGRSELAAMKPDGWLINVARGGVVDEAALIAALRGGEIGGACLDVFAEEPLPMYSPLWDMPNVIITPHNSWSSPQLERRAVDLFLENLQRYVGGESLLNIVNKQAGY
ncbi:MAG: D-2-hydroxyacid dehydrogenase [Anaerolineae bacterium]|nr:D-2-hydroxyacid dehydrogenase [Anaerolineae bacterium]